MALHGGDRVLPGHGGLVGLSLLVNTRKGLYTSIQPQNALMGEDSVIVALNSPYPSILLTAFLQNLRAFIQLH